MSRSRSVIGEVTGLNCTTHRYVEGEYSSILALLDHSIRSCQHVRRNGKADLLRRFQIDHQLELRRPLDGNVGGLSALKNFVDHCRDTLEGLDLVGDSS